MMKGCTAACYITDIPVRPGEMYYCSAFARAVGSEGAEVALLVQWKDPSGAWAEKPKAQCKLSGKDRSAWTPLVAMFTVPQGVAKAVVCLIVNNQEKQDAAWFDDVELYRIP
jgi:hypothetical protein